MLNAVPGVRRPAAPAQLKRRLRHSFGKTFVNAAWRPGARWNPERINCYTFRPYRCSRRSIAPIGKYWQFSAGFPECRSLPHNVQLTGRPPMPPNAGSRGDELLSFWRPVDEVAIEHWWTPALVDANRRVGAHVRTGPLPQPQAVDSALR